MESTASYTHSAGWIKQAACTYIHTHYIPHAQQQPNIYFGKKKVGDGKKKKKKLCRFRNIQKKHVYHNLSILFIT